MDGSEEAGFRAFVRDRSASLLRTAYLLTGDRGNAEDLVQTALLRAYRHWPRISTQDRPDLYVRKIMINVQYGWWRRLRIREHVVAVVPDSRGCDEADHLAQRDELWRALHRLPRRMREVLVLRYWEDLSEADTAAILDCAPGTVKSQASRGLARLRAELGRNESTPEEVSP